MILNNHTAMTYFLLFLVFIALLINSIGDFNRSTNININIEHIKETLKNQERIVNILNTTTKTIASLHDRINILTEYCELQKEQNIEFINRIEAIE